MNDFYGEMAKVASEVLAEFNQGEIKLLRPTAAAPADKPYRVGTPGAPEEFPLDGAARGVLGEYIDGTVVIATDKQVTAAVFASEPQMTDTISVDGRKLTIVKIIRNPDAGTVVNWIIICRG